MGKIKDNKMIIILIFLALIIFGFVASKIMSANKMISAAVPAGVIEEGTTITADMIKEIEISASTPGDFIRNPSAVIGSRIKSTVVENQLLYESNFMTSWSDFTEIEKVPDDYIFTSITVPDVNAVGGIITAGDYIDVTIVRPQKEGYAESISPIEETGINGESKNSEVDWLNNNAEFLLANVLVLTTNSALTTAQEGELATVQENTNSDESIYIIALCYNDYQKLREATSIEGTEIYLNICPGQNVEKGPLISQMTSKNFAKLHDAQKQVMDAEGNMLVDDYYTEDENGVVIEPTAIEEIVNEDILNEETPETSDETSEDVDSEENPEGESD